MGFVVVLCSLKLTAFFRLSMSLFENIQIRRSNFTLIKGGFRRKLKRLILAVSKALFLTKKKRRKNKKKEKEKKTRLLVSACVQRVNRLRQRSNNDKALQLYKHITCIGSNSKRLIRRFADFIVQRNKRFLLFLVQQKMSKRCC